jgi:hypothetical protein
MSAGDWNPLLFARRGRERGEELIFDGGWPADTSPASRLAIVLVWQHLPCCERTRIARGWVEFDEANGARS